MGSPDTPKSRDPAKDYQKGIDVYLKNLPKLLGAEQDARNQYDPERVLHDLELEDYFGEAQTNQQLDRLKRLDPEGVALRKQLMGRVSEDLASGYELPQDFRTELEQESRGSQAARGNILGASAGAAETAYKGRAALDLYNRRLANAGTALGTTGPIQQLGTAPVRPDRAAAYTQGGGAAGSQGVAFGQQQYQNQLAAAQNQGNPWASAIGGAASGAAAGYSATGSPYGAAFGALVGGYGGYSSSDARGKEDIRETGETTRDGIPIVTFQYVGTLKRFRGVLAQAVEKIRPEAVIEINGWKFVNYPMLGTLMQEVE